MGSMHKTGITPQRASDEVRAATNVGRYALVTGGGSGIGAAFCHALADRKWTIAVADCDQDSAEAVLRTIEARSPQSLALSLDVTSVEAWQQAERRLRDTWPKFDLLVNNAGTLAGGHLHEAETSDLLRLMQTNACGTLLGCHTMTPWLLESASTAPPATGHDPRRGIINIASIFASLAPPGFAAYSASKAAVVALSESLRGELVPLGLNVTVALPGVTQTPLFQTASYTSDHFRSRTCEYSDRRQMAPELVAEKTLHAASAGQLYAVIGQQAKWRWRLKGWLPSFTISKVAADARRVFGSH